MATSSNLRNDLIVCIDDYVREWRDARYRMPATVPEIVIMALVKLDKPCSHDDTLGWMRTSFIYCGICYCKPNANHKHGGPKGAPECSYWHHISQKVFDSFNMFDIPLREDLDVPGKWSTRVRGANSFLRRQLFSRYPPDQHFPIMKLPPEIRDAIFRYALLLPPSGTECTNDGPRHSHSYDTRKSSSYNMAALRFRTTSREYDEEFRRDLWWHKKDNGEHGLLRRYKVRPSFFNVLHVSKTFQKEALPCFWSQNFFYAREHTALNLLIRRLPREYRHLLENVGFRYHYKNEPSSKSDIRHYGKDRWNKIMAALSRLPRLRRLVLDVSQEAIPRYLLDDANLRSVRGLREFELHGFTGSCSLCKEAEASLKAEMMSSRELCSGQEQGRPKADASRSASIAHEG